MTEVTRDMRQERHLARGGRVLDRRQKQLLAGGRRDIYVK
jgi:hypothetical protein